MFNAAFLAQRSGYFESRMRSNLTHRKRHIASPHLDGGQLLASEIVRAADRDGDAVISFDEFEPW